MLPMIQLSIPYRNMPVCREIFLRNLRKSSLIDQFHFTIIEQPNDGQQFNLAKLQNVGFDIVRNELNTLDFVFMFHPIDCYPESDLTRYLAWERDLVKSNNAFIGFGYEWPNEIHCQYYKSCMYLAKYYAAINGYSNLFWGYGKEDDDFFMRMRFRNLPYYKEYLKFEYWDENDTTIRDYITPNYASPSFAEAKEIWMTGHLESFHHIAYLWNLGGYTEELLKKDGLSTLTYEILEAKQIQKNVRQITVKI